MSDNKHDVEGEGAKPRDHTHTRHHFLKHIHHDWRFWAAVILMLALIGVYVVTIDLSHRPGKQPSQPVPAENAP